VPGEVSTFVKTSQNGEVYIKIDYVTWKNSVKCTMATLEYLVRFHIEAWHNCEALHNCEVLHNCEIQDNCEALHNCEVHTSSKLHTIVNIWQRCKYFTQL
jgi:hypothetical protein